MVYTIIKNELKNYFKNPIYYIGAIIVFVSVYSSVSTYFNIHYFNDESEIRTLEIHTEISDADIMDGYIPASTEEEYEMGLDKIRDTLTEAFDMKQKAADILVNKLRESDMSIMEIAEYLETNYSFNSAQYLFYDSEMKKASVPEANDYIQKALEIKTFSNYFSRKYADYFGVYIIFYSIFIFAFLFIRDSKRDIYELLHTKPLKAWQYITGKVLGGMAAILPVVIVITIIFDLLVVFYGCEAGFPVSAWDIWYAVILYILPNLFMVISVYTGVAVLFKNPLPAVPALVLYMIYSNLGSVGEDGRYGYQIRTLAILVRFPDTFFETVTPAQAVMNQIFLVMCAILIFTISIIIWRRRRVY